ncbi:MAG: ATP-binding protein [Deltaproteobacteria bacterium]|nr:ATP-binding protein [Deltaproteobacteria bacterium]
MKSVNAQSARICEEKLYRVDTETSAIFLEFYSYRELIFEAIDDSGKFLIQFITESEAIVLKVILRELLMNAVIHGNRSNEELVVKCSVEHLGEKHFKISVEDEGNGFDYRIALYGVQDFHHRIKRKGYLLIKKLSEQIQFNDRGNRVIVYLTAKA